MRTILIVSLLCVMTSLSAQKTQSVFFGASVYLENGIPLFEETELTKGQSQFGYRLSLDLYYDINERMQLNSGLLFKKLGLNYLDYSPLFPCDHDGNGGALQFNSWFQNEVDANYIGIPVQLKYKLIGEANHLYVKPGLTALFKISDGISSFSYQCGTETMDLSNSFLFELNSSMFSFNLGLGGEFLIMEKAKIIIEPELEYGISSFFNTNSSAISNSKFLSYGVRLALRFIP